MIIWGAAFIPIICAAILFFFFKKRVVWWELPLLLITIIFIALAKFGCEAVLTRDTEYWTGWVVEACYYEKWTEEWDEYIPEEGHYDSKGSYHVDVPAHWEHRIVHHPPHWEMKDSNDIILPINEEKYKHLVNLWKNQKETNLFHVNQTSRGDGDLWTTKYKDIMVICTTTHSYENRVQASNSIFNFEYVKNEGRLFEYPKITDHTRVPSILGSPGERTLANRQLCEVNAKLGKAKQVRIWILLYHDTMDAAFEQEAYWKGGNKNEFIVCIGIDNNNNVKWSYIISWTEVERLKIDVRDFVNRQEKLDLPSLINYLDVEIRKQWQRKQFADFAYLTVEPPTWIVVLIYVFTLVTNAGLGMFIVLNEFKQED